MRGEAPRGGPPAEPGPELVWVWLVDPDACGEGEVAACEALLDDAERARAARLRAASARRSYVVAHALARRSLSRFARVAPRDWRFAIRPGGRPEVGGPEAGAGLRFSLSHTEGLAACAVARGVDVGVDVEAGARLARPLALAERFFAPEEAASLRALPECARREGFLTLWAAKEAVLKARGVGLAGGLAEVRIDLAGAAPALLASGAEDDAGSSWQLVVRRPTARHALALAVRRVAGTARAVEIAFDDGLAPRRPGATAG